MQFSLFGEGVVEDILKDFHHFLQISSIVSINLQLEFVDDVHVDGSLAGGCFVLFSQEIEGDSVG